MASVQPQYFLGVWRGRIQVLITYSSHRMSGDIERVNPIPTPVLVRPRKSQALVKTTVPLANIDSPTNTLELYKKYLSCLCAVCITCIVLTFSLLVHLLRDTSTDSFQILRSRVLDVKDSDLSACYSYELYSHYKTNQSSESALFLSDLISQEQFLEARSQSRVTGVLDDVLSFSGYLTVDQNLQSNLFFWFIPKETNAHAGPLVLWLQGGPGWPSMFGMFKENGPFLLDVNKEGERMSVSLVRNIHSWHKVASILYIDNPVGTGFSFTREYAGYPTNDSEVADQLVVAVSQFFKLLPYYIPGYDVRKNAFFVFGESYGGPYTLALANRILSSDQLMSSFNLQGIALGNPLLSPLHQFQYSQFLQANGYLSRDQLKTLQYYEEKMMNLVENGNSREALGHFSDLMQHFAKELNNTYLSNHGFTNPSIYDMNYNGDFLTSNEYICYLQTPRVTKSIHVGDNICKRGSHSYTYLEGGILTDKMKGLETVLDSGKVRVLLYTGNMDIMIHTMGMNRVVQDLNWTKKEEFHSSGSRPLLFSTSNGGSTLAGYFGQGGGLTYLVVRGAGHMVPVSQPEVASRLVQKFLHHKEWGC